MNANQRNTAERFLNIFTEVRPGEGLRAVLLSLNIFMILTSYYIIKPVREALILAAGTEEISGAVLKSLAAAGQVLLLSLAVPFYGWLASRFPRRKLINVVTFFFTACLILFYILAISRVPLGVVFFLWVGIFNLMIPAQFWAFANDLYTPDDGKRIFVLVAFGAAAGAVVGGIIANTLIEIVGLYQLLLLAGAILSLSLIITNYVDSRQKKETSAEQQKLRTQSEKPLKKDGAFRLVFRKKYLLMIAFLMLMLNWVNTNGEYILGRTVEKSARDSAASAEVKQAAEEFALREYREEMREQGGEEPLMPEEPTDEKRIATLREIYFQQYIEEYIGNFYAGFFTAVNLLGLFFQLFIVSRILKYLGIRIAIMVLPIIALAGYSFIAFIPVLAIIRWAKISENATDYSLQNTVRQVLFLPTSREEKYKAKQAIDTFFWRAGDLLSTAVVTVGATVLMLQVNHFALVNLFLVIVWLILAYFIGKENVRLTGVNRQTNAG